MDMAAHSNSDAILEPSRSMHCSTILKPYRSIPFGASSARRNELFCIYQCHCLTRTECAWILLKAQAYGEWRTQRHNSVPTTDMEVLDVPELRDWLYECSRQVIFPTLASFYGFDPAECHYMDLFLVRYDADTIGAQRGLIGHRDRSLLSFNILLSDPSDFEGGGTSFDVLDGETVHPMSVGDLTIHPGKVRHSGIPIIRGERYILVGFVDVRSPRVDNSFLAVSSRLTCAFACVVPCCHEA